MKAIKEELYRHCQQFVQDRLDRIQQRIANIQESLTSETKSTAGDKHETGRAMLQLEREKSGQQLAEAQKLQKTLLKIDITSSNTIHLGSIILTSQANYFLSISVGKLVVEQTDYYAIAAGSPIGKLLLGKKEGDHFSFNGNKILIKKVA
ncbi:3-oxoacyl-ACP synthase [Aquimarina sp. 2201CG5-10]|uniref:3-oxoacyl-ACP synthase n=1 Tax=Aquimarina callyspongiae TaxID=3098150 RepID=UPI002AB340F3|nr:3-oxoacyl-ACP synthase [Aquimarina sp. 2201CG5-10]MDY8135184.1 3-oxoacyl-ACP synthase [Aquimarina sp. 2201CG5-10]